MKSILSSVRLANEMQDSPSEKEVAIRARQILSEGGFSQGEFDCWLQAEYEFMQLPTNHLATLDMSFFGCSSGSPFIIEVTRSLEELLERFNF
ncbi:MAG: hypothetical protein V4507_07075 [Verrucomicrobiota bacterium]